MAQPPLEGSRRPIPSIIQAWLIHPSGEAHVVGCNVCVSSNYRPHRARIFNEQGRTEIVLQLAFSGPSRGTHLAVARVWAGQVEKHCCELVASKVRGNRGNSRLRPLLLDLWSWLDKDVSNLVQNIHHSKYVSKDRNRERKKQQCVSVCSLTS